MFDKSGKTMLEKERKLCLRKQETMLKDRKNRV